jgi:hypothetical protein
MTSIGARIAGILLALSLVVTACVATDKYVAGHDCSTLTPFFHMPIPAQVAEFSRLTTEDKYIVYLCGNQFIHPPTLHLAEPLARTAPDVVPFLTDRLSQTTEDLTTRDIVLVFSLMRRLKTYDVRENPLLKQLMTERVNAMKNANWRQTTLQMLRDTIE